MATLQQIHFPIILLVTYLVNFDVQQHATYRVESNHTSLQVLKQPP